jgi:hypothetical protein
MAVMDVRSHDPEEISISSSCKRAAVQGVVNIEAS